MSGFIIPRSTLDQRPLLRHFLRCPIYPTAALSVNSPRFYNRYIHMIKTLPPRTAEKKRMFGNTLNPSFLLFGWGEEEEPSTPKETHPHLSCI